MPQCSVVETVRAWIRNHFVVAVVGVAGVGFLIRALYVVIVGPHAPMGLDAAWYVVQGHAINEGHGYVDPRWWLLTGGFRPTANFPPLWPVVLSFANRIGLGTDMRNQFVGVAIGTITIVVTGLSGRRVVGPTVGFVAAVLVACSPVLIAADGSLMAESLYVLLILTVVWCAYRALEDPTPARFALVGLILGLAALTRSDALFLAPIMLVVLCRPLYRGNRPRMVAAAAAMTVAVLVPVGAFAAYSSARMDALVLTTSNSGNMLTGANCGSTYYGNLIGAWDHGCASNLEPGEDEPEWAAAARARGFDYAREHAKRLPLVIPARILRVWGLWDPVQSAHLEVFETRNIPWQIVGWVYHLVVLCAAVGGTVIARRRRLTIAPMIAVVLGVVVTAALSNGNQRFRLAADPLVAIGAAVCVTVVAARVLGAARSTGVDVAPEGDAERARG